MCFATYYKFEYIIIWNFNNIYSLVMSGEFFDILNIILNDLI